MSGKFASCDCDEEAEEWELVESPDLTGSSTVKYVCKTCGGKAGVPA